MKIVTRCQRLLVIYSVLTRFGINDLLAIPTWLTPIRGLKFLNPWYWYTYRHLERGVRIRLALEQLGPIAIKFGQVLSTRSDLLPQDIADELAKLQDQVTTFDGAIAVSIIEQTFKIRITELFATFDSRPLAAASIAQVHAATLFSGESVIVKILRPHIGKLITRDLDLLYLLARGVTRCWSQAYRLRLKELIDEFRHALENEQDLLCEAANAAQLRRNFSQSSLLYVPKIYWDYCRKNILVMERVYGVPIGKIDILKEQSVNMKKLAENGVTIFFTQVFRDNFFHADMHPGNIFVGTHNPNEPYYIGIDFGIMGILDDSDKNYLAENFLAFFNRDYRRIATLHVNAGWVPAGTRVSQFESAIRTVCEPIFDKPLKDISFGQLLIRLFQTAGRFNMEIQPQLLLLQKTLLNIEALGRQLYPELDLWTTAKPFLENWLQEQKSISNTLKRICSRLINGAIS